MSRAVVPNIPREGRIVQIHQVKMSGVDGAPGVVARIGHKQKPAPAWGSAGQSQVGSHLFTRDTQRVRAVAGGLNRGRHEQKSPRQLRVERGRAKENG